MSRQSEALNGAEEGGKGENLQMKNSIRKAQGSRGGCRVVGKQLKKVTSKRGDQSKVNTGARPVTQKNTRPQQEQKGGRRKKKKKEVASKHNHKIQS